MSLKANNALARIAGIRRRWRIYAVCGLLILLTLGLYTPVKTVKGLLTNTGLSVVDNAISIDAGRIAFLSTSTTVTVYDVNSGSSVNFATPTTTSYQPIIFGDNVIINANITGLLTPSTIYYCNLPHATPLQSCGAWQVATKAPGISFEAAYGFPVTHGDLVVWPVSGGFSFWRFSSETMTTISTPTQAVWPSTNGEIIAFLAKPTSTASSFTVMYYDTSNPSQGIVNTGLPSSSYKTSISQDTIVFNDNSTSPNRIRYYDILSNTASPAGGGPLGNLTAYGFPSIWGDRIVFSASEKSLGFDCSGDGIISSSTQCLQYWNIRAPGYIATTLAADAAPVVGGSIVIYDKTIAFQGSDGHLQVVTVPMKGDVNMDGAVDANDQSIVNSCLGQLLKGTVC
jgi:hypothetical protein